MTKKQKEQEAREATDTLRAFIEQGQRIYTSLQHVSSSGMSRRIKVYVAIPSEREGNGCEIRDISWHVAKALQMRYSDDKQAIVVGGAGMDMGYHVVHSLSRVMFKDNFSCLGEKCPSNDHVNDRDGSWKREPKNLGRQHSDGGYALTHSWL